MSAEGWCPRHDKIFTSSSGRCPECGTALIDLGKAPPRAPRRAREEIVSSEPRPAAPGTPSDGPEQEPSSPRSARAWVARGLVAASIASAFALGLVFPRTGEEPTVAPEAQAVNQVLHPAKLVATDEGALRLERVVQTGNQLVAEFAVFQGFGSATAIEGASVEVTTQNQAGGTSSFGIPDVKITTGPAGFTIAGTLEVADERVVEIRVTTVQVLGDEKPSWDADISSIWPPGAAEPKVLRLTRSTRSVGEGSVRLTALLAWEDRLEAVFELHGAGTSTDVRYRMTAIEMTAQGRAPIAADEEQQISPSQVIVRFSRVLEGAKEIRIRATRVLVFLSGPWTFQLE